MADNLNWTEGSGKTLATDDIGGIHYPRSKISIGADGSATDWTGEVTSNRPVTATATLANVAGSASNVTLIAANASRKGAVIFNDSSSALYVKLGATASTSSFTYKLFPNETFEMSGIIYTGIIDGIWDSATGNARITEL